MVITIMKVQEKKAHLCENKQVKLLLVYYITQIKLVKLN